MDNDVSIKRTRGIDAEKKDFTMKENGKAQRSHIHTLTLALVKDQPLDSLRLPLKIRRNQRW